MFGYVRSAPAKKSSPFDRSLVEGPISPAVWKLAWPTMLQNLVAGLQGVIDHVLVGHLSATRPMPPSA